MIAALRILAGVAVFRLRRLEMANLVAAASIMVALRLEWLDVAVRLGYGFLLNILAYLINDAFDVDQDLASPNKDHAKAAFLKAHMREAIGAQIALAAILVAVGLAWSPGLVFALVLGAGICLLYSWKLKRMPYVDVVAMIVWGVAMPLVGVPADSVLGLCLLGQLGLCSAVFESIQVIRDHDEDVRSGVRTTAVRLGPALTLALVRAFIVLAAVYGALFVSRWIGPLMALAAFLPFRRGEEDRYWNAVRLVLGLAWLGMVAWVFWAGSSDGWIASVGPDRAIASLSILR